MSNRYWLCLPHTRCSRERSSATRLRSRTSGWARPWNPCSGPVASAAQRLAGNASIDPKQDRSLFPYIEKGTERSCLPASTLHAKGRTVPGVDFDRLRAEIAMEEVLQLLGFEPSHRSGNQWYGCCPLHESTSRRPRAFSVNVAIGRYYCHACGSRGHQLQLWAAATKMSLYPAAIDLCRVLGREVPWIHRW